MRRLRIVAFAYACEPELGSEPGAGWEWARMLAELGDVWVITRENNRSAIEAALETVPERGSLRFVYVDLPEKARFWKRGQRGIRFYYLLWQIAALRTARRLAPEVRPNLVWHVTLANAWLGSLAPLLGCPFVYGPVGGGVGTPWRMMRGAPKKAIAYEIGRVAARTLGRYVNPAARLAWSRATLILAQNEDTRQWLPRRHRGKAVVFPNAIIHGNGRASAIDRSRPKRTALFAGRLIFWKRPDLALTAVSSAQDWRLLVCGSGPEEAKLQRLAKRLDCEERIEFLGWQARDQFLALMSERADVLLFPSLHDESPWVVTEALACGLPVICCDRGGPPALAGSAAIAITPTTAGETAARLAAVLEEGVFPDATVALARARDFTREAQLARLRMVMSAAGVG